MERVRESRVDLSERIEILIERASDGVSFLAENAARLLIRIVAVVVIAWVLFTIAVAAYALFRFAYLPTSSHIAPVHLNFNVSEGRPTACVQLAPDESYLLRAGQAYDVSIQLEVPESNVNKELGMIMVRLELLSGQSGLVASSDRHTMLRYRSWLHDTITTVTWWPLVAMGMRDESQGLHIFMLENFVDTGQPPITRARVYLDKPLQLYSAQLRLDAHFTGLRYLLYWYPIATGAT